MRKIFCSMVVILLFSCVSSQKFLGEKYEYHNLYNVYYSMEFKEKNQYVFKWTNGLINGTDSGCFVITRNHLFFNSFIQIPKPNYSIDETRHINNDSVLIELRDEAGLAVSEARVLVNETLRLQPDSQGRVKVYKSVDISKIEVLFFPFEKCVYEVNDKESNHFIFTLNMNLNNKSYINSCRAKVFKNKLVLDGLELTGGRKLRVFKIK